MLLTQAAPASEHWAISVAELRVEGESITFQIYPIADERERNVQRDCPLPNLSNSGIRSGVIQVADKHRIQQQTIEIRVGTDQ
jgi:hypothetical protein